MAGKIKKILTLLPLLLGVLTIVFGIVLYYYYPCYVAPPYNFDTLFAFIVSFPIFFYPVYFILRALRAAFYKAYLGSMIFLVILYLLMSQVHFRVGLFMGYQEVKVSYLMTGPGALLYDVMCHLDRNTDFYKKVSFVEGLANRYGSYAAIRSGDRLKDGSLVLGGHLGPKGNRAFLVKISPAPERKFIWEKYDFHKSLAGSKIRSLPDNSWFIIADEGGLKNSCALYHFSEAGDPIGEPLTIGNKCFFEDEAWIDPTTFLLAGKFCQGEPEICYAAMTVNLKEGVKFFYPLKDWRDRGEDGDALGWRVDTYSNGDILLLSTSSSYPQEQKYRLNRIKSDGTKKQLIDFSKLKDIPQPFQISDILLDQKEEFFIGVKYKTSDKTIVEVLRFAPDGKLKSRSPLYEEDNSYHRPLGIHFHLLPDQKILARIEFVDSASVLDRSNTILRLEADGTRDQSFKNYELQLFHDSSDIRFTEEGFVLSLNRGMLLSSEGKVISDYFMNILPKKKQLKIITD